MTPLPAEAITGAATQLTELHTDGEHVWVVELDPARGRFSLLRDGQDVTPEGRSVSTSVYEYGGCALHVVDDVAWFVDTTTGGLVERAADGSSRALTRPGPVRYADPHLDATRRRLLAVAEDTSASPEPTASVVAVDLVDGTLTDVVVGHDFVSNPRVSPDGTQLAYVRWSHPQMPWDAAEVVVADLDGAGRVTGERVVAGGDDSSAGTPRWGADGTLYLVWDRSGWWNVHRLGPDGPEPVRTAAAGVGGPGLNLPDFDVLGDRLLLSELAAGRCTLVEVDLQTGSQTVRPVPSSYVRHPRLLPGGAVWIGGSATDPVGLWRTEGTAAPERVRSTGTIDAALLAEPEHVTVTTRDGASVTARVWLPTGAAAGPHPTLVHVHGGPVLTSTSAVVLGIYALLVPAYWTSRGYAYVDVDYRGTVGYGRAAWQHLYGRWGQSDVQDVEDVVHHLVDRGVADPRRLAIRGASAGGWTTTHALTQSRLFAAGTAYFPVTDLLAFEATTHKLESHYVEQLVGPRDEQLWADRSSVTRAAAASGPVLLIQGTADKVCPPQQSEAFAAAVVAAGGRAEVVLIPDEGHGFVRAASNTLALQAEEAFYAEVLGG